MLIGTSGSDEDVKGRHKLVRRQAKQTCQPSTETNVGQSKRWCWFHSLGKPVFAVKMLVGRSVLKQRLPRWPVVRIP